MAHFRFTFWYFALLYSIVNVRNLGLDRLRTVIPPIAFSSIYEQLQMTYTYVMKRNLNTAIR
jgi:hypothetical protein